MPEKPIKLSWMERLEERAEREIYKRLRQRGRIRILDTVSGIVYNSREEAGRAVAREFGLEPDDPLVYYSVIKENPSRFKEIP